MDVAFLGAVQRLIDLALFILTLLPDSAIGVRIALESLLAHPYPRHLERVRLMGFAQVLSDDPTALVPSSRPKRREVVSTQQAAGVSILNRPVTGNLSSTPLCRSSSYRAMGLMRTSRHRRDAIFVAISRLVASRHLSS